MNTAKTSLKAPSNLKARTTGATSIGLTWTASPTPGALYNVLVWVAGSATVSAYGLSGVSGTSASLSGLAASTSYKIQIQAYILGTKLTARSNYVPACKTMRLPVSPSATASTPVQAGGASGGGVGDESVDEEMEDDQNEQ
jgi:hypothetical protein